MQEQISGLRIAVFQEAQNWLRADFINLIWVFARYTDLFTDLMYLCELLIRDSSF